MGIKIKYKNHFSLDTGQGLVFSHGRKCVARSSKAQKYRVREGTLHKEWLFKIVEYILWKFLSEFSIP